MNWSPCHCLCQVAHPGRAGICQAEAAVTTRRFVTVLLGPVDVPLCAPCAAAGRPGGGLAFTCPRCGRTSWHAEDARNGYCGACHAWTGDGLVTHLAAPDPCPLWLAGPHNHTVTADPGRVTCPLCRAMITDPLPAPGEAVDMMDGASHGRGMDGDPCGPA